MGDVMLGRLVDREVGKKGYGYVWGDMLGRLRETDINIINLETTLTRSTKKVPKVFNFRAQPDRVQCLVEARVDVCNLANNHILDFSKEGLVETIATLDGAGIRHVGAGKNEREASEAVVIEKEGVRVGVIGFTDNEAGWEAKEEKCGTNYVKVGDIEKVKKQVEKLRGKVDVLVLTIHWGPNMRQRPSRQFRDFARKVIDAGVDIFHGHSAHIFQGIEVYKGNLILYDTGDFVDDYAVDRSLRNDESFLYLVEVDKGGVRKAELVPVLISEMQVNKAKGRDYKGIIGKMRRLSREFGTRIKETDAGVFVTFN
ncbi:MAG: CapA family protein [Planctomycetota bacterium]|nr:MAG: CapA family protein [Planctomycetota bacterium]